MSMFSVIFRYELRQGLREPSHYVYALVVLVLAVLAMASLGEAFDAHSLEPVMRRANAPWQINKMALLLGQLLAFAVANVAGQAVWRDHKSGIHQLLYTYPFGKGAYLAAKGLSALWQALALGAVLVLGLALGLCWPGLNPNLLGPPRAEAYLYTYIVFMVPNIGLTAALVFGAVTLSRQLYVGYLAVLLLLVFQWAGGSVLSSPDTQWLGALLDPWGERAAIYATRQWSAADYMSQALPLGGVVLYNRLLWLGVATGVLVYLWYRFEFSPSPAASSPRAEAAPRPKPLNALSAISLTYSWRHRWGSVWVLALDDLRYMYKSKLFVGVVIAGFMAVVLQQAQVNPAYGIRMLPVSWRLLQVPYLVFSGFIYFLTFLYAGHLLQRARLARMDAWLDLMALPDWVFLTARWLALVLMQALLLALLLVGGIGAQLAQGYYKLAVGQYLWELYGLRWPELAIWACAAIGVQTLLGHTYLGVFVLVLGAFGVTALPELGIEAAVFRFNQGPVFRYSELGGYGDTLLPYGIYKVYWGLAGLLLMWLARLFWVRGADDWLLARLRQAWQRCTPGLTLAAAGLLASFLSLGVWLYAQDEHGGSREDTTGWMAESERRYRRYEQMAQPRIVAVSIEMDVHSARRSFSCRGSYLLVNQTRQAIDSLLVHYSYREPTRIWLSEPVRAHQRDSLIRCNLISLERALAPGDSLRLYFEVSGPSRTALEVPTDVGACFAYIRQSVFPGIGYREVELSDARQRQQYGLSGQARSLPSPDDSLAQYHNYYRQDANEIYFDATLSVDAGLTAIAPGSLRRQWQSQGRQHFYYQSEGPIRPGFAFMVGKWAQTRFQAHGLALTIYHHPDHTHNLHHLFSGWAAAINFNGRHFGASHHQAYQLVEYPLAMGTEATLLANMMPFSESYFLIDVPQEPSGAINFPFYVSAHETSHHWWGHQLVPARAAGAKMLTESLAEYAAIRSLEHIYGRAMAQKAASLNASLYRQGHHNPDELERPLVQALPTQDFINYRKGALAFWALSHYSGGLLDGWLCDFLSQYPRGDGIYPRSTDLIHHLHARMPDSLRYLVADYFEAMLLYDNRVESVQLSPMPDGRYRLEIYFRASKYHHTPPGQRGYGQQPLREQPDPAQPLAQSLPLADYLEIGIFADDGTELYLQKHRVQRIFNTLVVILDHKPATVSLDPYHQLLDINPQDNLALVGAHSQ